MTRHKYTEEQDQFLIDNVKGITLKELRKRFNEEFDLNLGESAIQNRKVKLHITSGIVGGQFQKGQISWNKGRKWSEYMSEQSQRNSLKTTFKKGNIPINHRKVGSERTNIDGYWEIKIEEPNKWELKHRYLYKQNKGDIPDGHKIIFADGDRNNLSLDNLIMVSSSEELIMNRNNLRFNNQELTKTGSIIAKVIDKTNKVRNERL